MPQSHSSPLPTHSQPNSAIIDQESPTNSRQNNSTTDGTTNQSGHTTDPLPPKTNNWRVLSLNANSIVGKAAEFANLVDYVKPDVIIMTETKLGSVHSNAEFMPPGYSPPKRKDRKVGGGGVLVCVRDCYPAVEVEVTESNAEVVWVEVSLRNNHKLHVGGFYRPPNGNVVNQLEELDKSLQFISNKTKNNPNHSVMLSGDFNLGDINWETETIDPNSSKKTGCDKLIQLLRDHNLAQMQRDPTRNDRLLDLFCTNKPSLVKAMTTVPGISDHDAIVADSDIKPAFVKKTPRSIFLFSKANWENMRNEVSRFATEFLSSHANFSVEHNWSALKTFLTKAMETHIPSKKTSRRQHLPWLTGDLKRRSKKKHRMYKKARASKRPGAMAAFRQFKKATAREQKRTRWQYVNNIVSTAFDEQNTRPFWKYVKSQRQDSFGVPPLKKDGLLHTDSKEKAEIMLDEFKSVLTPEDKSYIPTLSGRPHVSIDNLVINEAGVTKLLKGLDPNKASGPDNIPCRVLKELAHELSPVVTALFRQSLDQGSLPVEWTEAIISPVFKKGNIHLASNYRPVSLTCVLSKLMEHVICKHILNHLDAHNILTVFQHGFRKSHSCETQLLLTIDDLMTSHERKMQTDIAVLDFSRAFDTVPHERLLGKLDHYGIRGPIKTWIRSFLCNRKMWVAIDGSTSLKTEVVSGVPQGTVLGPLLFLLFINDLPDQVSPGTTTRLFADDCLAYRSINSIEDQIIFQKDLTSLNNWADKWGMRFNPSKCNILRISRSTKPLTKLYDLRNETLKEVSSAKYLGITISQDLEWSRHVDEISRKANNTLAFLRRNLKYCPRQAKQAAYFALVRSTVEYSSAIWDPRLKKDKTNLEKINRRAARFVMQDYKQTSSVTSMLEKLEWPSLEKRREHQRLTTMYKIVHGLVAIPTTNLIPADSRTRSNHDYKFRALSATSGPYKYSFFPRTIPTWNQLSKDTAESATLESFKRRLP